jgi:co-chaperonin GroES (HSP10)
MSDVSVRPTGHFVLVEMVQVQEKTKSGIILGSGDTTKEQAAAEFGVVRAIGPTAFVGVAGCDPTTYPTGSEFYTKTPAGIWGVDIGDTVQYARYEGQEVKLKGMERFRYIPDVTIKAVVTGDFEITKASF